MPRCSFRALNDLEGLNCKRDSLPIIRLRWRLREPALGLRRCLVREFELPYSVNVKQSPTSPFLSFSAEECGRRAEFWRKLVTGGESVRINKQLCWVAGLAEGQGGD
jgi:hypothetical protein